MPLRQQRHTAQEQPLEVFVRYSFHPLAEKRVAVIRCYKYSDLPHYVVEGPDKCRILLPAWMTDPRASSLQMVETPRLSIDALLALCRLFEAKRSSLSSEPIRMDGVNDEQVPTATRSDACKGYKPAKQGRSSAPYRDRKSTENSYNRVRFRSGSKQQGGAKR